RQALAAPELAGLRSWRGPGSGGAFAAYGGRALFEAVVRPPRGMVALRGARPKPRLRLVFVLTQQSWKEFPAVLRLADDSGVDELQVQSFLNWGKQRLPDEPPEGCALEDAELARARSTVLDAVATARRVHVILPFPQDPAAAEPPLEPGRCQWPFNATWVTADGAVTPCCNLHDPRVLSFGNAFEAPLETIWL